jgi:hypothetical protein
MNATNMQVRTLERLQRWMQTAIVHPSSVLEGMDSESARSQIDVGAERVETVLTRSRALTAVERLAIYGTAYYARLLECLRDEFPVLKQALGEELFDAFAVGYLQEYPSQSYTLVELGANFPRHLAETRPDTEGNGEHGVDWPDFLIDLATLERTFNEVFDGPGTEGKPPLDAGRLLEIPPEEFLESRLVSAACLRLLALRYPVHRYYSAIRNEQETELPDPAVTFLAVSRRNYIVRHHELSRPAYELLSALVAGQTVGEAIAAAVERAGPDIELLEANLTKWFQSWAEEGFFSSFEKKVSQ